MTIGVAEQSRSKPGALTGRFDHDKYVEVTMHFRCNLKCEHCMIEDTMDWLEPESIERFHQLLDFNAAERRWTGLILTGSEITLDRRLPQLARMARRKGFQHVRIQTHGMRLAQKDYCRELLESGVDEFFVSVTASTAEAHDAITCVPGSFERTLRGLENLDTLKGAVTITNTVITRRSYRHLRALVRRLGHLKNLVQMEFWNYWPMNERDEKDLIVSHLEVLPYVRQALEEAHQRGRGVEVKNFPECLLGEHGRFLDNTQSKLFIDPAFWREFMRTGFNQCVHRTYCGAQQCLGLNTAYVDKFGWQADSLVPLPRPESSQRPTSYCDAFRILVSSNRFALQFGARRAEEGKDSVIRLLNQLVVQPRTAKRLLTALNGLIAEQEARFGQKATSPDPTPSPGEHPAPPAQMGELERKPALLFQLVDNLNIAYGYERSFRMCRERLLSNRFLLSISKAALRGKRDERILEICREMNMPQAFMEATRDNLAAAAFIHFGFEHGEQNSVFKVYLERAAPPPVEGQDPRAPILQHLGFKWDPMDNAHRVLSRYVLCPSLSVAEIRDRIGAAFGATSSEEPRAIARRVLELAANRAGRQSLRYMEVAEEENQRKSFDLNVYDASLKIEELSSLLVRACRHFSIPNRRFEPLYDQIKLRNLGHLAGGVHRRGQDFLTVYFGVEGRHG